MHLFLQKIKRFLLAGLLVGPIFTPSVSLSADCATLPSRVAIHYSFELMAADQQKLMNGLTFDCSNDLAVNDISDIIKNILVNAGQEIDAVEPFRLSSTNEDVGQNSVLNFLVSTPMDDAQTRTVILPLALTNRPISDFVNFASIKGVQKVGEEIVLRFALEAQTASQFNVRPFITWKRDGVAVPSQNTARYLIDADDAGATLSAELRLENAKGALLAVEDYAASAPVEFTQMPPKIIGLQLNGDPEEGQALTVAFEIDRGVGNEGDIQTAIKWMRDGNDILGAQLPRYNLTAADIGKIISVEVTPSAQNGFVGDVGRAQLTKPIQANPSAQGKKVSSLSMADIAPQEESTLKKGVTASTSLTLEKVIEEINQNATQAAPTSLIEKTDAPSLSVQSISAPPSKPKIVEEAKVLSLRDAFEDRLVEKDGLQLAPIMEDEKPKPSGPLVKDSPKELNGDRTAINCFKLIGIELADSTVIDNATRDALLDPFIQKCTTPALVGSVLEVLNNYYIDEGYVTTRAYVAPQDLRDGRLDIVIVEGRIETINFKKITDLSQLRVDLAFPVKPGDVLNINSLERGLDQMNVPASNRVTMNMLPGSKPGYSIIDLEEEKIGPETRIKLGLDNMGSQGTGEDRLTLGVDMDHILGLNDTWSFSHIGSLDTNALAINGTVPFGDWTFNSSYSYSDYLNYIDEATQLFGKSETMEMKADKLVHKADGNEFTIKTSINKKTSKRTIGDVNLKSQRMSVGRIGFGFSRKSEAVFSGNVYLAQGLKFFGAESDGQDQAAGAPRAQFTKIQFDASYYRPVFKQIFLQSALAGQISSMPLYGSEQISAGGKSSVRGFARNTISGDAGFYIQNDFLFPMPQVLMWGPLREYIAAIKPFAGFDFAYTSNRATYDRNTIAGLGLGAKFAKGPFSGDLGIGIPIYRKEGSQGNRVEKYVKILYQALEF